MTGRAGFHLTRRAALDLRDIHRRSVAAWGKDVADRYVADLYVAMNHAAAGPGAGRLRQHRSVPFLMIAARKHFVIYDTLGRGVFILAVMHQARDVESLIADMTPSFFTEIDRLRAGKT